MIELKALPFAESKTVHQAARHVGSDVVITFDNDSALTLKDVKLSALTMDDFRFVA